MEILRRTPWSRIREQNIVYKEFLDIVGNGKQTGSVWKETLAVSATISISVEKLHRQIRLPMLSCSRMSENRREPEVPLVECFDGFAMITSKELAITHSVKNGILQNACSARPRAVADLVKSARIAHRQVDEQPTKRSKKNDDKSAVAILKKGDWHERGPVTDQLHDRSGQLGSTVEHRPVGKLVQQSLGEALQAGSSKPTQSKPNPMWSNGETCGWRKHVLFTRDCW